MMYGCSIDQRLMLPRPARVVVVPGSGLKAVALDGNAAADRDVASRLSRLLDVHDASQAPTAVGLEVHDVGMAAGSVEDRADAARHLEDVVFSGAAEEVDVDHAARAVHEHDRFIG